MHQDTHSGGSDDRFPQTRRSVVARAGSDDERQRAPALDDLIRVYWKPVYKYLRVKWNASNDDAKDWTQAFFTRTLTSDFFARFDPSRAAFRTYLRTCLDNFVSNVRQAEKRIKRGGDRAIQSLDFDVAERELARQSGEQASGGEAIFHREWVRHVFGLAVDSLRQRLSESGHRVRFELFEAYDLNRDDPDSATLTYDALAAQYGLSVSQVTNRLFAVRRQFRDILIETLRDVCGSEAEYREEARKLLGSEPR
jgi:RNA polymerase sigma factor (sigma-70 family)